MRPPPRSLLAVVRALLGALAAFALYAWWDLAPAADNAALRFILWGASFLLLAVALPGTPRLGGFDRWTALAVFLIVLALPPRIVGLETLPFRIAFDEAIHPLYGWDVLRNDPWRTFEGASAHYFDTPYFDFVLQGWPAVFVPGILGGRLASVAMAVVSMLATFALARLLFSPRAALLALLVLAVSHWHIVYSRLAHPYMQPMMLVPLGLALAARGAVHGRARDSFLAGGVLGVSLLAYTPARIAVPICAAWWLLERLRGRVTWTSAPLLAAGLAVASLPYFRSHGSAALFTRFQQAAAGSQGDDWLHTASAMGGRALRGLSVYVAPEAWMAPHDVSANPILDPATLALCCLGLAYCLFHLRQAGPTLVWIWVAATFIAAQVLTDIPQAAYRAATLLPALALAAGAVWDRTLHLDLVKSPFSKRGPHFPVLLSAGAFVLFAGAWNLGAVADYAGGHKGDTVTALARFTATLPGDLELLFVSTDRVVSDERFRWIAGERRAADVPALMDSLGRFAFEDDVAVVWPTIFVGLEGILRRCYPEAEAMRDASFGTFGVQALLLPRAALQPARDCAVRDTPGLRARYYSATDWSGEPMRERVEDIVARWGDRVDGEPFGSVEWTGRIRVAEAGRYRFFFRAPGEGGGFEIGRSLLTVRPGRRADVDLPAGWIPVRLRCLASKLPSVGCLLLWSKVEEGLATVRPADLQPH